MYFVCEYDVNSTAPTIDRLEKSLPNVNTYQDATISPLPRLTSEIPNTSWQASISTTTQATATITQSPSPPRPIPSDVTLVDFRNVSVIQYVNGASLFAVKLTR